MAQIFSEATRLRWNLSVGMMCCAILLTNGCAQPATSAPISQQTKKRVQEEVEKPSSKKPAESSKQQEEEKSQTDSEKRTSRLDAAIKKLNEKEPMGIHESMARQKDPVPDREIHEALKPMVKEHWIRLHPGYEVWLDPKDKQVIVGGRISIHDGMLEMFACPIQTKDHESIIATISDAQTIHAGLLASGAIAGRPTRWMPDFIPAFGPKCEMLVHWKSDMEVKTVRAQEMVLDIETEKTLDCDWVFCGSRLWVNPDNPEDRDYQADHGELISVSNFPSSMMDLEIESSNANAGLRFQANKEKIPAPGTPVLITIKPDTSTNPAEEKLRQADIAIAKAEKQLREELEKARKERKERMRKQREEEKRRKAELEASREKNQTP